MKKMVVILCTVVLGIAFLAMPVMAGLTCGEQQEKLSDQCECDACTATALNLKATPTCDGLELTWNDIGAEGYVVAFYNPIENRWFGFSVYDTSFLFENDDLLPTGTYSFVVIPNSEESELSCYSNIVCDAKMPTTCTNTPEFPSPFLPAAMIIGFLGAVLLIQRTREQ